jgi:hypothetical protein
MPYHSLDEVCQNCALCQKVSGWTPTSPTKRMVLGDVNSPLCLLVSSKSRKCFIGDDGVKTPLLLELTHGIFEYVSIAETVRCNLDPAGGYDKGLIMCSIYNRYILESYPIVLLDSEAFTQMKFRDQEWSENGTFFYNYTNFMMIKKPWSWSGVDGARYNGWLKELNYSLKPNIIKISGEK